MRLLLNLLGKLKYNSTLKVSLSTCCRCANCSNELTTGLGLIKCMKCGQIQPPPPTQATPTCCPNYYTLLVPESTNSAPRFRIDLKELKREYLKLQSQVHPDKMQEGSMGASWSSWINRANETLRNPLQRAIYLVNLHESGLNNNGQKEESVISYTTGSSDSHDISLVLEVREAIADSSTNPQILSQLKTENDARIEECCRELEKLLDGRKDFEGARRCINRLRYWMGVEEELQKKMI